MGDLPVPGGGSIIQDDDPERTRASVARFSRKDADAYFRFEEWIGGIADILGPMLMRTPPHVGSRRFRDIKDIASLGWQLRKHIDEKTVADITRLFTMSATDLLDRWFESPIVKGLMAVNGIIGTWSGPEAPGTAYVLLHHSIGEEAEGKVSSWGMPEGGMGAVADAI